METELLAIYRMKPDRDDKRNHPRHFVDKPCRIGVGTREFSGTVVNMSMTGAAVLLDQLEVQPPDGSIMELSIQQIGRIEFKILRRLLGGFAVEFILNKDKDTHLVDALDRVLNEHAGSFPV